MAKKAPRRRAGTAVPARSGRKAAATAPPTKNSRDVAAILRLALLKDPASAEGKAALRAAETAAVRIARDLKRQARRFGGPAAVELEKLSLESYSRAVLARELPKLIPALKKQREPRPRVHFPTPPARPLALLPPPLLPPEAPTNVVAEAGIASARVQWTAPPQLVASYEVIPRIGGAPQPPTPVGSLTEAIILGLTVGTSYTFTVKATNVLGTSPESAPSNAVTPTGLPTTGGGPLDLQLPAFSSDPALLIDQLAEPFRAYVADAGRAGQKWRYEHLKAQAIRAAQESLQFEQQILQIMALAVSKMTTAEELLNDTLIAAAANLQQASQQISITPEIEGLLKSLGDAAAQSLLLPKLIAWLVETGPINFWIGLFEAIICDLASVIPIIGSATTLGRTKRYLGEAFTTDIDGVQTAIRQAAQDLVARLDAEVDAMVAPLRQAVDQVIGGTKKAMADVFEGFDLPLLMTPSEVPGRPDVADVDPFQDLYERLTAQVDRLAFDIKRKILEALKGILEGGDSTLFKIIVVTFLVLPILVFLVISLAGGPFSAALLAAAVLLAAEELLRLLVRWLTGPLLGKVEDLKKMVVELVGRLQTFFAAQADLVRNNSPETIMKILAGELRQLRDFLPEAFLEESAALLEEARNVILRTATQLGLAAEQALGLENATAFESVDDDNSTRLAPAPQLPGGRDPARLAGAALLRDIGRLEEQRTAIRDGKELVLTHRLSLLRLLGNNPAQFLLFRQRREVVIELTELDLVDRMFPGVYRALIDEVRVTGIFGAPVPGLLRGIPLTITHLGESRTRIKLSANPAAPPLALPDCLPLVAADFSAKLLGRNPRRLPNFPWDWDDGVLTPLVATLEPAAGPPPPEPDLCPPPIRLEDLIRRAFGTLEPLTIGEYAQALIIIFLVFLLLGIPDAFAKAQEVVARRYQRPCLEQLLESLDRAVREIGLGIVDPSSIVAACRRLLELLAWADIMLPSLIPPNAGDHLDEIPDLEPAITALAVALRNGITFPASPTANVPGVRQAAEEAHAVALAAFRRRIARWGDATLEEDADPQIRSLGFATLVRRSPAESVVFNLFAPGPATETRAELPIALGTQAPPFAPASSLQYKPLENRGVEGKLLLRLETIGDDGLAQLSDTLTDLVLEITLRGCFDEDLARTVRASRRQTASGLGLVSNLSPVPIPIAQPGSLVRLQSGTSERRTVHYSLRAHRDKTLQVWSAAAQVQAALVPNIAALLPGKAPLARDAAFTPLQPLSNFVLELRGSAVPNNEASLLALAQRVRVTPADLGFDGGILSTLDILDQAELLEVGLAVIPMPGGVRGEADPLTADPLGVTLDVPAPLDQLLTGFAGGAALPQRLKLSGTPSAPPRLADLFTTGAAMTLGVLPIAFDPEPLIYDVIFSLTFRVPVLEVGTRSAALV